LLAGEEQEEVAVLVGVVLVGIALVRLLHLALALDLGVRRHEHEPVVVRVLGSEPDVGLARLADALDRVSDLRQVVEDVRQRLEVVLADLKLGKLTPEVVDNASHQIALRLGKAVAPTPAAAATATAPEATPTTPAGEKEAPPVTTEDPLNPF